jgi:hypothetical protein
METDGPLKLLFREYPEDLLPLTGDVGATVRSAGPVELQALKRHVDCVLELERNGEVYYRHIEFQAAPDPEMPARVFRYNGQLVLEYSAPVLTTVIHLLPPRPSTPPVFSVRFGGREVNRWHFEQMCLWDLDARDVLTRGASGLLALVPLMRGGEDWDVIEQAVRQVERSLPGEHLSDAEDVLLALAGRYYTVSDLARIVGRERMSRQLFEESSVFIEARAQAERKGRVQAERELCIALAAKHHPTVIDRARPQIEACEDPARLTEWALAACDLSDADYLTMLGA